MVEKVEHSCDSVTFDKTAPLPLSSQDRGVRGCKTTGCRNNVAPRRSVCWSCRYRAWEQKYPMQAVYKKWKSNVKRRKIPFSVSFEEFKDFCNETDYMNKRGLGPTDMVIDRIDSTKGYTRSNMQALTQTENGKKSIGEKKYKQEQKPFVYVVDPDCGF